MQDQIEHPGGDLAFASDVLDVVFGLIAGDDRLPCLGGCARAAALLLRPTLQTTTLRSKGSSRGHDRVADGSGVEAELAGQCGAAFADRIAARDLAVAVRISLGGRRELLAARAQPEPSDRRGRVWPAAPAPPA